MEWMKTRYYWRVWVQQGKPERIKHLLQTGVEMSHKQFLELLNKWNRVGLLGTPERTYIFIEATEHEVSTATSPIPVGWAGPPPG